MRVDWLVDEAILYLQGLFSQAQRAVLPVDALQVAHELRARDEERSRDEPEHAVLPVDVLQAAHELQAPDEERSRYEPERAALTVGLPQAARELQAPDEKRSRYEPGREALLCSQTPHFRSNEVPPLLSQPSYFQPLCSQWP